MKAALQEQINEKQRKKEQEKERARLEELKDEMRVKVQMRDMAIAEGMLAPEMAVQRQGSTVYPATSTYNNSGGLDQLGASINARRTAYAAN